MTPDSDDRDYFLAISWLYDRIVKSGSQIPVIDLAYELVLAEEFVGECVTTVRDEGLLTNPEHESVGGMITPKVLKMLKQVGLPLKIPTLI